MKQLRFLILALGLLLADQISKWYVMERVIVPTLNLPERSSLGLLEWYAATLERLPYTEIAVWPFFNLVMVWNHGISFGLFNAESDYVPTFLILLACVISLGFAIWLIFSKNWLQSTAIAFVIGGALGNALDRVRFEAVIDFLDFHLYGYHWPAFNIGDSAIVVGVIILMVCSFNAEPDAAEATEASAGHNP